MLTFDHTRYLLLASLELDRVVEGRSHQLLGPNLVTVPPPILHGCRFQDSSQPQRSESGRLFATWLSKHGPFCPFSTLSSSFPCLNVLPSPQCPVYPIPFHLQDPQHSSILRRNYHQQPCTLDSMVPRAAVPACFLGMNLVSLVR